MLHRDKKKSWLPVVFRSCILRSVSDERNTHSLVSELFKNSFLKQSVVSEFKDLYVNVAVSFLIKSLIIDQPRF